MWRDYLGYAAAVIAVVNGALAMLIARMPPRRSVLQLRLGAVAIALAVVALGATIYDRYHARSEVQRQQSDRVEMRKRIENFALEGRTLLAQIKDDRRELPTRAADEWAHRAEIYLRDTLGERAVARFRRDVGELYGNDSTVAPARMGYWQAVRTRTINLDLIGAELADTPLRR
jgi:hypothetical protein